jgi:hypothetical protein
MATLHDDDDDAPPTTEGAEVEVENDADEKGTKEPIIDVIEDDGADERIAQPEEQDDVDEGEKPRRQKESAAERRARAKLAKERDKKELDFQRRELARQDALIKDLQKATTVNRVTELDNRIATAQSEAETYDQIFGKAITAKNGEDARAAAAIRDAAKQRAWEAHQEKLSVIQQSQRQPAAAPPYQGMAEEFMAANPWYDHSGRDADSRIVKEIDAQVAKEYIPTSPAYWRELQRRVQKNLPQHFQSDDNDDGEADVPPVQRQRKGPPTGGSSRSNSSTSTQIRLSPERVEAMKQAGAWDDPVLRTRMAKAYANYDKNKPNG